MNKNTLKFATSTERIYAYLIDFVVLVIVVTVLGSLNIITPSGMLLLKAPDIIGLIAINILFVLKDISGQGPGKWVMKIKVVDATNTSQKPSITQLVVRYVALCIWPLDLWVYWHSSFQFRFGDKIANTRVVNVGK